MSMDKYHLSSSLLVEEDSTFGTYDTEQMPTEIQPESMEKFQSASSSASDKNSEDQGSNLGWISMSFVFAKHKKFLLHKHSELWCLVRKASNLFFPLETAYCQRSWWEGLGTRVVSATFL